MHDLCTAASAPFLFSVQSRLLAWLSYTTGRGAGLIPALGLPSSDLSITSLLLSRTEFGSGAPLSTASPGETPSTGAFLLSATPVLVTPVKFPAYLLLPR